MYLFEEYSYNTLMVQKEDFQWVTKISLFLFQNVQSLSNILFIGRVIYWVKVIILINIEKSNRN